MSISVQSAKQKGRLLQQATKQKVLDKFPQLQEDDVHSRPMGSGGEDLMLSPLARSVFPFSVECKNQERLNIWEAIKQAEANGGNNTPLVVFKRNRSEIYAILKFDNLLELL